MRELIGGLLELSKIESGVVDAGPRAGLAERAGARRAPWC